MKHIFNTIRPSFLILAIACVFLGTTAAIWTAGSVNAWHVVLAFIGGLASHACVNALNEYTDNKSGLDSRTSRTPFSGGSGTFLASPDQVYIALWVTIITALIVTAIGVYFTFVIGWQIALIGGIGLLIIFTYTRWLNQQPFFCLIAPGLGFGTLMVLGTFFVLTSKVTWAAVIISFIPFFLVSNLLLLNQFPDVEADKSVGRRHYPILIGRKASARIYSAFLIATYIFIILGVILRVTPVWTLLGLLSIIIAIPNIKAVLKNAEDVAHLLPSLGQNVLLNLLTPVLVGIGFLIA